MRIANSIGRPIAGRIVSLIVEQIEPAAVGKVNLAQVERAAGCTRATSRSCFWDAASIVSECVYLGVVFSSYWVESRSCEAWSAVNS